MLPVLLLSGILHANPAPPPRFSPWRHDEDYSYLRDESLRSDSWWEALKELPLDADGFFSLTLGGELRARHELYVNDEWRTEPAADHDGYQVRALPCADLHLGPHFRVFTEIIAAFELELPAGFALELASVVYWRQSTGDGIYDNGGGVLRPDGGSDERFVGTQIDAALSCAFDRTLDATIAYSAFLAGPFVADTGSSATVHFTGLELRLRF